MTRNIIVKSRNLSPAIIAAAIMFGQPAFADTEDDASPATETKQVESSISAEAQTAETTSFWDRLKTGFAEVSEDTTQSEPAAEQHEEEHKNDLEDTQSETT